jgi:hypothetical protein
MGFLGVWAGSHVIKNMNEFLKFLKKVDQCSTFEGKIKIKIQFGVVEKKLCYSNCSFLSLGSLASSQKTSKIKF